MPSSVIFILPNPTPIMKYNIFLGFINFLTEVSTFIYLLYRYLNHATVGLARIKAKEREKNERRVRRVKKRKRIEVLRVGHPTPSRAIDALIGYEEQSGKQKRIKRRKQGAGPQPSYLGPFSRLLRLAGIIR